MHDGLREHLQFEELSDETNVAKGTLSVLHLACLKVVFQLFLLLCLQQERLGFSYYAYLLNSLYSIRNQFLHKKKINLPAIPTSAMNKIQVFWFRSRALIDKNFQSENLSTHILSLLDGIQHVLSLLIIPLVLLKLLLTLGQKDTAKRDHLRLSLGLRGDLHLDRTHHLAQVGIGNAELGLFKCL